MSPGFETPHWRLPAHVPVELLLDADPWRDLSDRPHDAISGHSNGLPMRYVKAHPLPGLAPSGAWFVTDARAIRKILIDNKAFANRGTTGIGPLIGEDLILAPLESDPPDHGRMRKILHPFFQPPSIERYRVRVRALAASLIDDCLARERCDFLKDFAEKLPTTIFLELMGLPQDRLAQFMAWEEAMLHGPTLADMMEAWQQLRAYLAEQIGARREQPMDDLMSVIVAAEVDDRTISDLEALGMCMLLFAAGLDTVVMSLCWQFRHLAEHPEQQAALRADPSLIPAAVEEYLRAFSISTTTRIATRDIEIAGIGIRAGDVVTCPTPVGSRDTVDFTNPDTVDFARGAPRHFAFGFGPHICLGMHLARLEMVETIGLWLERVPPFKMPEGYQVPVHGGLTLGVDALELVWERDASAI